MFFCLGYPYLSMNRGVAVFACRLLVKPQEATGRGSKTPSDQDLQDLQDGCSALQDSCRVQKHTLTCSYIYMQDNLNC